MDGIWTWEDLADEALELVDYLHSMLTDLQDAGFRPPSSTLNNAHDWLQQYARSVDARRIDDEVAVG